MSYGTLGDVKGKQVIRGFTIVELLVTIVITGTIAGIILSRQRQFEDTVKVSSSAYEVALALREAQVRGVGTEQYQGQTTTGYGIHFDKLADNDTSFILFVDRGAEGVAQGNGIYDYSSDPILRTFNLPTGNKIGSICIEVLATPGILRCDPPSSIDHVDVVFERPNSSALISDNIHGGPVLSMVKIEIVSAGGVSRSVRVLSGGQVAVQ